MAGSSINIVADLQEAKYKRVELFDGEEGVIFCTHLNSSTGLDLSMSWKSAPLPSSGSQALLQL
jgi:hypothetical protein